MWSLLCDLVIKVSPKGVLHRQILQPGSLYNTNTTRGVTLLQHGLIYAYWHVFGISLHHLAGYRCIEWFFAALIQTYALRHGWCAQQTAASMRLMFDSTWKLVVGLGGLGHPAVTPSKPTSEV